jgi:hypothetical protein
MMSVKFDFNYDNQAETKQGSATFNSLDVQSCDGPVNILVGYDLNNCMEFTINSENDLRNAIYDAVALLNSATLKDLCDEQENFCKLTDDEIAIKKPLKKLYFNKCFHPAITSEMREKLIRYGQIEREKQSIKTRKFHIVLKRGKNDRNYIRTKSGYCNCYGYDIANVNFQDLYTLIMKTESECRMLDQFISGVCENL